MHTTATVTATPAPCQYWGCKRSGEIFEPYTHPAAKFDARYPELEFGQWGCIECVEDAKADLAAEQAFLHWGATSGMF